MEILEAFDLVGSYRGAAELAGCDHHTVKHYVARRDAGRSPEAGVVRASMIDAFRPKIDEFVARSGGEIRADVVHDKLTAMGFAGTDRTTRRAVAEAKKVWRAGTRRVYAGGSPSRAAGCSSIGAGAQWLRSGRRCCSARGWRGHGSGL